MPRSDASSSGARLILLALCLMVGVVPLVYLPDIYDYVLIPKLLALHLCIALACLGWLLRTRWGRDVRLISSPLVLPALCFMGVTLLSAPSTTHPLDTLVELLNQAALIALFFVVANALSLKRLKPVLWANAVTGLVVSLIGILQYHNLAFVDIPTNGHPSATFGYRNLAAMYLVCALPLVGLLFLTVRGRAALSFSGLSATLMGVYLVYTRTRSAWVGAVGALVGVGAVLAFWPGLRHPVWEALWKADGRPTTDDRRKGDGGRRSAVGGLHFPSGLDRRRGVLALGFGVLFVLLSLLPPRFRDTTTSDFGSKSAISSTLASISEEGGDKGRLVKWRNTLHLIADHPLLGVGPGGWKRAYPLYDGGATISMGVSSTRPHNDYLWIASEVGLIGLGVYLYLLVTAFRCLLTMARSPDPFPRVAALMFALSLLATLGDALFNFPREWPQATMFFYLLLGVVAAATRPHPPPSLGKKPLSPPPSPRAEREGVWGWVRSLLPYLLLVISLTATFVSWRRIGFDRHYLRVASWGLRENWKAALTEARRALEYGTFRPHVLFIEGSALENLGRYAEAEAAYRQTLVYTPHAWYAHNGLGSVCLKQGRLKEALEHGQAALSICPTYAEAHSNLGLALKTRGDLDGAISHYRQALRFNPGLAETHSNLGLALAAKGDLDNAIQEYQQALKIKPDLAETHNNLGLALAARGDLDNAIQEYQQALKIKPDYAKAHVNLGVVLAARGDLDNAIQEYQQALKIKPDYAEAHGNLGLALKGKGDRAGAIRELRAFLHLSNDEGMKQKVRDLLSQLGSAP